MKLYTKDVSKLNKTEYSACYDLNMRERGDMRATLYHERTRKHSRLREYPRAKAIMAWENGKLLGWALLFDSSLYMYVRRAYRRRGIGKKILARALQGRRKNLGPLAVFCHDHKSTKFYEKTIETGRAVNYW